MTDGYIHNQVCQWHEDLADLYIYKVWEDFIDEGGEIGITMTKYKPDFIFGAINVYGIPEKYFGVSLSPLIEYELNNPIQKVFNLKLNPDEIFQL